MPRRLGREASQFQTAVTRFFDTIGRIDPLDVIGAPNFLPRIGRLRGQDALKFFAGAVDDIVAARRALIATGATPPEDLLTMDRVPGLPIGMGADFGSNEQMAV